jgi:hypothetical protein
MNPSKITKSSNSGHLLARTVALIIETPSEELERSAVALYVATDCSNGFASTFFGEDFGSVDFRFVLFFDFVLTDLAIRSFL